MQIKFSITAARWAISAAAGGLALAGLAGVDPASAEDFIDAQVDQAKIVQLPDNTATVIIGNPIVADVTMLKGTNKAVLTGKGFGETNFIALDRSGNSLGESIIRVKSTAFRGLTVQRGLERESYTCAPRCLPSVNLSDSTAFMAATAGSIQSHNAMAGGGGPAAK